MSKKKLWISVLSLMLFSSLFADIQDITSLGNLESRFSALDRNTLVIFDVDDVLITCKDPTLQVANKERLDKVCAQFAKKLSLEEYAHLFSIAMVSREVEVIDSKIYDLIQILNENKAQMVALTHTRTGQFGVIDKVEDWRVKELSQLGIRFESNSPFPKELHLNSLVGPEGIPNIQQGIIFTASFEKGRVLQEAFKYLKHKPKRIVFIDDRMDNLQSVENFCKEHNIAFDGYHYTLTQSKPAQYIDEKLIEIQLDTLLKEHRWITSEEAAEAFNDEHL